jgi:hypothetical protein
MILAAIAVALGTELACWQDSCDVTVWDESLGMCYAEDQTDDTTVCSEFRVYLPCAPVCIDQPFVLGCVNTEWRDRS